MAVTSIPRAAPLPWRDTPRAYGRVSRALHWGMAALFAWQFAGMGIKLAFPGTAISGFMVGTHGSLGALLMLLVLLRAAWGLSQIPRRPPHGRDLLGRLALAGHLAVYALMLLVPALALLRAAGSGRGYAPFGLPLFPAFEGGPVPWMVAPGDALHGWLGWLLLALVAGHITMAIVHRAVWRDDVLQRMAGGSPGRG